MLRIQQQFMELPEGKKQEVLLLLEEIKKAGERAQKIIDDIRAKDD